MSFLLPLRDFPQPWFCTLTGFWTRGWSSQVHSQLGLIICTPWFSCKYFLNYYFILLLHRFLGCPRMIFDLLTLFFLTYWYDNVIILYILFLLIIHNEKNGFDLIWPYAYGRKSKSSAFDLCTRTGTSRTRLDRPRRALILVLVTFWAITRNFDMRSIALESWDDFASHVFSHIWVSSSLSRSKIDLNL